MAIKNKTVAASNEDPTAAFASTAGPGLAPKEGFTKLSTDRSFYKPGETRVPLEGYVINIEKMHSKSLEDPTKAGSGDFVAATLRLTEPTECYEGNELVKVEADSDVMLVLTASLLKLASQYARGQRAGDRLPLVRLLHLGKKKLPGGKTKNEYHVEVAALASPETWALRADVAPDTIEAEDEEDATSFNTNVLGGNANGATKALPSVAS